MVLGNFTLIHAAHVFTSCSTTAQSDVTTSVLILCAQFSLFDKIVLGARVV